MFWGLVLKTNKRYSQKVTKAFHVSQAVLDLGTVGSNDNDAVVQIWLNSDDTEHLIANVSRQTPQVRLDLAFTEGEDVSFYSKGHGTVHLSGYLIPDDDDFGNFPLGDEEEDEEEEESEEEEVQSLGKKQKAVAKKQAKEEEEDDDEDDDDDDSDDLDLDGLQEELEDEELEDEEDSDDEDDDEDDDEEEEDDEDEEIQAPPAKQAKFDKNAKQNGLTNGKVAKKENEQKQKNQKHEKQEQKQKNKQQQNQQQNQQQKSGPKTIGGGVQIQDLRVGTGPEAKQGRKVSVYYEGRLKSNNKVFDSTKSGDGFKFRLGAGEVIKGWDIGVAGMKVGSKRRITCPPGVAYGPRGAPPAIPGNATLVFDVELRGVN